MAAVKKKTVMFKVIHKGLWDDDLFCSGRKYRVDEKGNLEVSNAEDVQRLSRMPGFKLQGIKEQKPVVANPAQDSKTQQGGEGR